MLQGRGLSSDAVWVDIVVFVAVRVQQRAFCSDFSRLYLVPEHQKQERLAHETAVLLLLQVKGQNHRRVKEAETSRAKSLERLEKGLAVVLVLRRRRHRRPLC